MLSTNDGLYHNLTSHCVVGVGKGSGAGYMIESRLISWHVGFHSRNFMFLLGMSM